MDLTLAQPSLFSYPNAFHGFGGSPGFWRSNRSRLSFSISFLIFLHSVILWSCGTLLVDLRIFTTIVFNSEQCEQPFLHLSFFFPSTAFFFVSSSPISSLQLNFFNVFESATLRALYLCSFFSSSPLRSWQTFLELMSKLKIRNLQFFLSPHPPMPVEEFKNS